MSSKNFWIVLAFCAFHAFAAAACWLANWLLTGVQQQHSCLHVACSTTLMPRCCVCSNNTHDSNAIRVQLARPSDSNAILEGGKEAEKARGRESGKEGETAILEGEREGMVIGYLPKPVACWLGPLADIGAIVMTARSVCCLCRGCGRDCQSVSTVCACAVRGLSCHSSHARSSSACEGVL